MKYEGIIIGFLPETEKLHLQVMVNFPHNSYSSVRRATQRDLESRPIIKLSLRKSLKAGYSVDEKDRRAG
jgi:hypothetical protein